MKRILAALLVFILIIPPVSLAENVLSPNSLVESSDGLQLSLGNIHVMPSENESTQATHVWIVIDAEIINFAVEDIFISEAVSGKLIYQDKYVFDGWVEFDQSMIKPLVQLKGRIIFEIPMLVAEAEPGNFIIEITANGTTYPFEIPDTAIESILISSEGQPVEDGSFVPSNAKLRFEWTATGDIEEYLVRLEDWHLKPQFSLKQQENWLELDISDLPPGDWYYLVVLPQPYFDLWTPYVEAYCSFNILKPTPSPEPTPSAEISASPEETIVYRTKNGKWYHLNENCYAMSGGKPVLLSDCQNLEPCPKCDAPAFKGR